MKSRTRQMLLSFATAVAIACAGAMVMLPTAASAAVTTVTSDVNLRDAPGGSVIGSVRAGERVDVIECSGSWCRINRSGPDGWISRQYLAGMSAPGFQLNIPLGNDGQGSLSFGIGGQPGVEDEAEEEISDGEVCFYERTRLRGDSFCLEAGDTSRSLRGGWDDRIASFDNPDGLEVTVCTRTNLRGTCRTYETGARTLGELEGEISSIEVN
jgi:uncharacterized protein YraI